MAYTMDSTLGDLIADARVRPILDQYVPGASTNPQLAMFKGLSLRLVVSNPMAAQFGVTEDKVKAFLAEVNKLG